MYNSPISKSKRTGYKRYRKAPFGRKAGLAASSGACMFCGYLTTNDISSYDDVRVASLRRLNHDRPNLWVCLKHVDPLLATRWMDLLLEITS